MKAAHCELLVRKTFVFRKPFSKQRFEKLGCRDGPDGTPNHLRISGYAQGGTIVDETSKTKFFLLEISKITNLKRDFEWFISFLFFVLLEKAFVSKCPERFFC